MSVQIETWTNFKLPNETECCLVSRLSVAVIEEKRVECRKTSPEQ